MPPAGSGAGGEGWDTKGHMKSRKPDQGFAEGVAAPGIVYPIPRILGGPARPKCAWVLLICVSWFCLYLLSAFCLSALNLGVCLARGGKQGRDLLGGRVSSFVTFGCLRGDLDAG